MKDKQIAIGCAVIITVALIFMAFGGLITYFLIK